MKSVDASKVESATYIRAGRRGEPGQLVVVGKDGKRDVITLPEEDAVKIIKEVEARRGIPAAEASGNVQEKAQVSSVPAPPRKP